jgi:hypothetical protein
MSINYKPLSTERADVVEAKRTYGIWFGSVLGLTFVIFAWGIDAYQLSHMNSLHPWLKLICSALLCTLVGGFAGWLSARFDKPLIALPIWITTALFFAWLTVVLPLQIAPKLLGVIEPNIQGLLHYKYYEEFSSRVGVAFAWIVVIVAINGLLQLPLSEGAVFSTAILGKVAPMLITLVLMGIAGTIIDGLNNEPLRSPIEAMNSTVQYYFDHQGTKVDPAEARKMHQGSLRAVQDVITPQRQLTVSGFDQYLGEIDVLVKFKNAWVECQVFYNQPSNCKQVGTVP